ncbi:hypothetical protein [Microbacterium sp.]|uniref:hypothetical protein n=1 Tax=Microbacterium sp. TaxID=51671 RepID=UPI0033420BB9
MRFSAVLLTELRKITSLWYWWPPLIALPLVGALMSFGLPVAAMNTIDSPLDWQTEPQVTALFTLIVPVGFIVPLVAGILIHTSDVSRRTFALTLLAEPNRLRVLAAKLVVSAGYGALTGIVSAAGGVAGGTAGLTVADAASDAIPQAIITIIAVVPVFALWGMIGTGLGALVPSTLIAVLGVLALTQVVEPVLRFIVVITGTMQWTDYLPGAVGDSAVGGTMVTLAAQGSSVDQAIGLVLMAVYALVLVVAGMFRVSRYELR